MIPKLGQIVYFVMPDSNLRPFLITRVLGDEEHNMVNGILFTDGSNDDSVLGNRGALTIGKQSVYFDPLKRPNTWHYPET